MVNNCANPQCNKPLVYLRDGRIFVFDVPGDILGPEGKRSRHIEHYWLCGDCSPSLQLERNSTEGVKVLPRPRVHAYRQSTLPPAPALAS
jgi:hypothetical protein